MSPVFFEFSLSYRDEYTLDTPRQKELSVRKFHFLFLSFLMGVFLLSCGASRLSREEAARLSALPEKKIAERGLTYFIEKNYDLAIDAYSLILARTNADKRYAAWARYETGFCYYYMSDYDKAMEHFRILLRDFPQREYVNQRTLAEMLINKIEKGLTDGI